MNYTGPQSVHRELPVVDEVEVLVVGAGPAGSSCAAKLAESGHEVLLIDKDVFPREKPCGDGLTPAALQYLRELDIPAFEDELHEVEALRLIFDHGHEVVHGSEVVTPYATAACVRRKRLDDLLVDAAIDRGAGFEQGIVSGPLKIDGNVEGVILAGPEGSSAIRARCVIAADGATSRLRRECGLSRSESGYRAFAMRQYFQSEVELGRTFDVFMPLTENDAGVIGYGWVFPVGRFMANVGVGYFREQREMDAPAIRSVYESFCAELEEKALDRYGILTPQGKAIGSPMGIGFAPPKCQFQNVLFCGDAAYTTDPFSGEGIANALHGGGLVAEHAHKALTSGFGSEWHRNIDVGRELRRRFLRLGQDIEMLNRVGERALSKRSRSRSATRLRPPSTRREPFLASTMRLIQADVDEPKISECDAVESVTAYLPQLADVLAVMNDRTIDEIDTRFPFATESIHREFRARGGPSAAALTLVAAGAEGRELKPQFVSAAIGVELLSLFPVFVKQVTDGSKSGGQKLNNVLAVLVADFVASRALRCGSEAGVEVFDLLSRAVGSICEGTDIEINSQSGLALDLDDYLRSARLKEGRIFTVAASIGSLLGGLNREKSRELELFALEFGIASRIADDLLDRHRAIEEASESADDESVRHNTLEFVPIIDESPFPSVFAATLECEKHVTAAQSHLAEDGDVSSALASLAETPLARARAAMKNERVAV